MKKTILAAAVLALLCTGCLIINVQTGTSPKPMKMLMFKTNSCSMMMTNSPEVDTVIVH